MGNLSTCIGCIMGGPEMSRDVKIYGDYFSPDTRVLLNLLAEARIEYKIVEVDTLPKQGTLTENSEKR